MICVTNCEVNKKKRKLDYKETVLNGPLSGNVLWICSFSLSLSVCLVPLSSKDNVTHLSFLAKQHNLPTSDWTKKQRAIYS